MKLIWFDLAPSCPSFRIPSEHALSPAWATFPITQEWGCSAPRAAECCREVSAAVPQLMLCSEPAHCYLILFQLFVFISLQLPPHFLERPQLFLWVGIGAGSCFCLQTLQQYKLWQSSAIGFNSNWVWLQIFAGLSWCLYWIERGGGVNNMKIDFSVFCESLCYDEMCCEPGTPSHEPTKEALTTLKASWATLSWLFLFLIRVSRHLIAKKHSAWRQQ